MFKKDLKALFSNLCCSICKNDFNENSVKILEKKDGLIIGKLVCEKCGKDFGKILLNLSNNKKGSPLEIIEGPEPITYDDVIDAHNYIKKHL